MMLITDAVLAATWNSSHDRHLNQRPRPLLMEAVEHPRAALGLVSFLRFLSIHEQGSQQQLARRLFRGVR
eukprot:1367499-Rhodomonas_salina.3